MFLFCLVFAMFCARLFICASWSPAGKGLDWKPPKQLKCAYTQPIPHTNKKLSSLLAFIGVLEKRKCIYL